MQRDDEIGDADVDQQGLDESLGQHRRPGHPAAAAGHRHPVGRSPLLAEQRSVPQPSHDEHGHGPRQDRQPVEVAEAVEEVAESHCVSLSRM